MYKCQVCQQLIPAKTKAFRLPIQYRVRYYRPREKVNEFRKDHKVVVTNDKGGLGHEIIRELIVCPDCYRQAITKSNPTSGL